MAIDVLCPSCRSPMSVPEKYAGRAGKCSVCGQGMRIPTLKDAGIHLHPPPIPPPLPLAASRPQRQPEEDDPYQLTDNEPASWLETPRYSEPRAFRRLDFDEEDADADDESPERDFKIGEKLKTFGLAFALVAGLISLFVFWPRGDGGGGLFSELNWRTYRSSDGDFSVKMPEEPDEISRVDPDTGLTSRRLSAADKKCMTLAAFNALTPDQLSNERSMRQLLDESEERRVSNFQGQIVKRTDVRVFAKPARRIRIQTQNFIQRMVEGKYGVPKMERVAMTFEVLSFFGDNGKLYWLAYGESPEPKPDTARLYFESFRTLPNGPPLVIESPEDSLKDSREKSE